MGSATHIHNNVRWMCLECWERIVAKPGQPLPFPTLNMKCEECGAQKVHVTPVRTDPFG
jgi:Zn finger protein HypA/HybF involved in hydrogenase expression